MSNHHDKLFKVTFKQPRHAVQYFESFLPKPIADNLDFSRAELQSKSFVDEKLINRESDLLYQIPLRLKKSDSKEKQQKIFLYVLFEAQSTIDSLMCFRLLRYMVRIWEDFLENAPKPKPKKLPVILPLVLYHGEKEWVAAKTFFELMHLTSEYADDFRPYIPSFEYLLDVLSTVGSDQDPYLKQGMVRVTLFLLKHFHRDNILELLIKITENLQKMKDESPEGLKNLMQVIEYILKACNITQEDLLRVMEKVSPKAKELTMTIAERIRQEIRNEEQDKWLAEGRAEGLAAGRNKVALKMIKAGLPVEQIANLTELSPEEVQTLSKKIAN